LTFTDLARFSWEELDNNAKIVTTLPTIWVGVLTDRFRYPLDRLFRLRDILPAAEIIDPNSRDHNGNPVRYVIKRASTKRTTIGCLGGFDSYQRRYNSLGHMDSIEMAIFSYNDDSGPFSRPGDSGAVFADSHAKFGGLVTGGTRPIDSSDVTYATPMVWLWNKVLKINYSRANLYFED
jgi:hypothetical protein